MCVPLMTIDSVFINCIHNVFLFQTSLSFKDVYDSVNLNTPIRLMRCINNYVLTYSVM